MKLPLTGELYTDFSRIPHTYFAAKSVKDATETVSRIVNAEHVDPLYMVLKATDGRGEKVLNGAKERSYSLYKHGQTCDLVNEQ